MTTIRNFGHYWSRDLIDWGWQGAAGSMLGAPKNRPMRAGGYR